MRQAIARTAVEPHAVAVRASDNPEAVVLDLVQLFFGARVALKPCSVNALSNQRRYSGAADDLRLADEWEAQARTKQLPSTRTEIGAGGELIDSENGSDG